MTVGDVCCGPIRSLDLLDSILPLYSRLLFSRTHGDQRHWTHVGCRPVSRDAIRRPLCRGRRDGVTDDQCNLFTSRGAQGKPPLGRCRPLLRPLPPFLVTPIPVILDRKNLHNWFSGARRYSTSSTNNLRCWPAANCLLHSMKQRCECFCCLISHLSLLDP